MRNPRSIVIGTFLFFFIKVPESAVLQTLEFELHETHSFNKFREGYTVKVDPRHRRLPQKK